MIYMLNLPKALNLVKKEADFRLMRGNINIMRKSGTVENWPQISSKVDLESSCIVGLSMERRQ